MDVERLRIHRRAVGEGHESFIGEETASAQSQLLEVFEGQLHGPLLGAEFGGVSLVRAAPCALERHTGGEAVGCELLVAAVGVCGREAVEVVALGLEAAAGKLTQVVGVVDVVLRGRIRCEGEIARRRAADQVAALVREADQAEPLPVGMGVFAQKREDRREIARAHGLHVADLRAAVDLEADHEEASDLGPRAAEHPLPAEHVGEGEVAVDDRRGHRVAFDGRPVLQTYGFEFDHSAV